MIDTPSAKHSLRPARGFAAACLALVATFALAGTTSAISWGTPVQLTTSGDAWTHVPALAATGPTSLIAVFTEVDGSGVVRTYERHSSNSGTSWNDRVRLSSAAAADSGYSTVAAEGQTVDVAWSEGDDCDGGPCSLVYVKSTDGGASFSAPLTLTTSFAWRSQVARSGQVVAVAWTDAATSTIRVRVSKDGGATFGAVKRLGKTTNIPRGVDSGRDGLVTVAAGTGVIYAAFYTNNHTLKMRRTLDSGATWKTATTVSSSVTGADPPSVSAKGKKAIVAYTRASGMNESLAVRRTSDKGTTWKPEQLVSASGLPASGEPVTGVNGSTWRIAFAGCSNTACDTVDVYLRSSTNAGKTWTNATLVAAGDPTHQLLVPYGVAYASKVVVMYWRSDWAQTDYDCWVRTGS